MHTALVISGGPRSASSLLHAEQVDRLALDLDLHADRVVAVDSGWYLALELGLSVDVLIGDQDSVASDDVEAATSLGVDVHRHPVDKDATDLELALDLVVGEGASRVLVVGAGGGRLDHQLGELLLLASDRYAAAQVEARLGSASIVVVRDGVRTIHGRVGSTLSILPVGGPARVTTDGLRWPLTAEQLVPGTTRGISNEFLLTTATVGVDGGCAVVVVPGEEMT